MKYSTCRNMWRGMKHATNYRRCRVWILSVMFNGKMKPARCLQSIDHAWFCLASAIMEVHRQRFWISSLSRIVALKQNKSGLQNNYRLAVIGDHVLFQK
jgi:hypothetical protein